MPTTVPTVATRSTWWLVEPLRPLTPIPYSDEFSAQELQTISRGFVPRDMDDRWFIFREGDSVFLHRSWTGHLMYRVDLEITENRARVLAAFAALPEQRPDAGVPLSFVANELRKLLRGILLNERPPEPTALRRLLSAVLYILTLPYRFLGSPFESFFAAIGARARRLTNR
jgi:hypothetical protein